MPMDLYGKRLAVGYGAMKRDGARDLLKPFNTRGITPAAGYTSTVQDLARFASWQFRLLRTGKADVLKASTLREMQRVQFMDPAWKVSYGLGFAIQHKENHTYVGHGGDCPGYQTILMLRPEDELGVILMDNSSERPGPWGIVGVSRFSINAKATSSKRPPQLQASTSKPYAGHYSGQPWESEAVMLPWAGGLASFSLPDDDPVAGMQFYKPKGGDVFRRVRDDGSEAEELTFIRDSSGKVTGFMHF